MISVTASSRVAHRFATTAPSVCVTVWVLGLGTRFGTRVGTRCGTRDSGLGLGLGMGLWLGLGLGLEFYRGNETQHSVWVAGLDSVCIEVK